MERNGEPKDIFEPSSDAGDSSHPYEDFTNRINERYQGPLYPEVMDFGHDFVDEATDTDIAPDDTVVQVDILQITENDKQEPLSTIKAFLQILAEELEKIPEEKRPGYVVTETHAKIANIAQTLGFHVADPQWDESPEEVIRWGFEQSAAGKAGGKMVIKFVWLSSADLIKRFKKEAPK